MGDTCNFALLGEHSLCNNDLSGQPGQVMLRSSPGLCQNRLYQKYKKYKMFFFLFPFCFVRSEKNRMRKSMLAIKGVHIAAT